MKDPIDLFFDIADRFPDSIAVECDGYATSYADFSALVREIAGAIIQHTAREPDRRVLIRLPRGAQAYASMFATLYAGGYYSPANLDHPAALQQRQLDRFEPNVIIGSIADIQEAGLTVAVPVIDPTAELGTPLPSRNDPHDLAYVIFTSGSTGEPKGVMVGSAALAHYTNWAIKATGVGIEDRWSQHPNLGFDLSVLDVYGALCGGATLVPINDRRERLVPAAAIRNHRLTIWNSVPSVVDLMRRGGKMTPESLATLRLMTFCGEPLLKEHLEAIFAARPDITVFNTYGPTEATVSMTLLRLNANNYTDHCRENVAIGDPISGMHILLEEGPDDSEGELVIAGPQVARGYWHDPVLTETAFGTREIDGTILPAYRTGDWVAHSGNDIYFASRIDRQIKIHGFRLELSSVEAALRSAGAVAACVVHYDGRLAAFIELPNDETGLPDLRARLIDSVPPYAVPQEIRIIDKLPRNANDKIDAGALLNRLRSE